MGVNHDFLAGNFIGFPLEENKILRHHDFDLKKNKINSLKHNILNNYEDSLRELDELREYKRIVTQKIKRYESNIYSFKNQIRNLKKNMFHGGEVNIQLINVFVNTICDIIEYLCSDINKPVLSALPFIHTILNSTPLRDKKIYQCSKLIHVTLTQINNENKISENEKIIQDDEKMFCSLAPNKLQDLEWLASETNDKGWLTVGDRWGLCKRDLKWLCVKTNNRSWLLYRHMWEASSDDLKYISVLFDDKRWLNLYNIWNFIPLSLKLRAISLKDPSICKPSLNEIMLKDDDIYKINILELNSDISDILKNNYLKYKSNEKMNDYSLRNTFHPDDNFFDQRESELTPYSKIKKRESLIEKQLRYNSCKMKEENISEERGIQLNFKLLPREQINEENNIGNKLCEQNLEKTKNNSLKKESFLKISKNENIKGKAAKKHVEISLKPSIKHKESVMTKKLPVINKMAKSTVDSKRSITEKVEDNSQGKETKIDVLKKTISMKKTLQKAPEKVVNKGFFNKQNVEKDNMNKKIIEKKEVCEQILREDIEENETVCEKEEKELNDKKKETSSEVKQKYIPLEKSILNNLKKENEEIKLPKTGLNFPKGKEFGKNKLIPEVKIPTKIIAPVNMLSKIKGDNANKYPIMLKKNESFQINKSNDILHDKCIEKNNGDTISKTSISTKIAAPLNVLSKIKEENLKKNSIILKKSPLKENMIKLNKDNNSLINESNNISNEKTVETDNSSSPQKSIPIKLAAPVNMLSKIKEENLKKNSITLKKMPLKENLLIPNKSSNSPINKTDDISSEKDTTNKKKNNITNNSTDIISNELKTIRRKESVFKVHTFINNEKEIKINTRQKLGDPQKEPQNTVTNYFTDLFNAFNFATKKDDDQVLSESENDNKIEKEETSSNGEERNSKEGEATLENEENVMKKQKNSKDGEKCSNDEDEYLREGKEALREEGIFPKKEKTYLNDEEKQLWKDEKYLKEKEGESKLKKKHLKGKKKNSKEKESKSEKKERDLKEKENESLEKEEYLKGEKKNSKEKESKSEKKERDLKEKENESLEKEEYLKGEKKNSKEKENKSEKKERDLKEKENESLEKEEYLKGEKKNSKEKENKSEKKERDLEEKENESLEKEEYLKGEKKNSKEKESKSEKKERDLKEKENESLEKEEYLKGEKKNSKEKENKSEKKERDLEEKENESEEEDLKGKIINSEKKEKHLKEKYGASKEKEDSDGEKKKTKEEENCSWMKASDLEKKEEKLNEQRNNLNEKEKEGLLEQQKDLKEKNSLRENVDILEKKEKEGLSEKRKDSKEKEQNSKINETVSKKKGKYSDKGTSELEEQKNKNGESVKEENEDDNNEVKMGLKKLKSIRSINSKKNSIKSNLQGYSIKGKLLKIEKSLDLENEIDVKNSEKELKNNNKQNFLDVEKEKDEIMNEMNFSSNNIQRKNKYIFLEKPLTKITKNNKPNNILQKLLDSDLSDFDSTSKKMTADEIAKHTNASLHISVKKKASLSTLNVKPKPKIKSRTLFNL